MSIPHSEVCKRWRAKNKAHIAEWEAAYRLRRNALARKRRKLNREHYSELASKSRAKHRLALRIKSRAYRAEQAAKNPNWYRERMGIFYAKHPFYWRQYAKQRRVDMAWRKWSVQCAHSRQSLGDGHG